ncbi:cupin domain-containing protein [Croceicoccus naphthovorans]|nr:cupin domain-containing protein [Croceicoccus naphthovorans]
MDRCVRRRGIRSQARGFTHSQAVNVTMPHRRIRQWCVSGISFDKGWLLEVVMSQAINIAKAQEAIEDLWSPKVLGRVNDQYVKAARVQGSLTWHKHDNEDELFLVTKGRLKIEIEGQDTVCLGPGEFFVVPKGVMHNPIADDECWIVLIETVSTKHTGDVVIDRTRSIDEQLA